jgi:hypothetical protein
MFLQQQVVLFCFFIYKHQQVVILILIIFIYKKGVQWIESEFLFNILIKIIELIFKFK